MNERNYRKTIPIVLQKKHTQPKKRLMFNVDSNCVPWPGLFAINSARLNYFERFKKIYCFYVSY